MNIMGCSPQLPGAWLHTCADCTLNALHPKCPCEAFMELQKAISHGRFDGSIDAALLNGVCTRVWWLHVHHTIARRAAGGFRH